MLTELSVTASSPLYYITALTALFESIAMIVDQHQPVVEKYYGSGKMAGVLARLLQESDRVVKDLLEGWEEERAMKRKVRDTHLQAQVKLLTDFVVDRCGRRFVSDPFCGITDP